MSDTLQPSGPTQPIGLQAEDTAYYRAVLHDLIHMGTNIARRLHDELTAEPASQDPDQDAQVPVQAHATRPAQPGRTPEALALAFDRVARAVRRTVLLAQHLDDDRPAAQPARLPPKDPALHRLNARTHLIRHVENRIHAQATGLDADDLRREFHERLESPAVEDDILSRPVQDVIDDILKDLGLHPYSDMAFWPRRTPAEIQGIRDLAAKPATPLTAIRHIDPAALPDPFPKMHRRCEGEAKAIAKILAWDHERRR